jgi:hypothetical protein
VTTDEKQTERAFALRRKLLWGVPIGMVAVPGCGGGGGPISSAQAAPAPAPAPAAAGGVTSISGWAARPAAAASSGQMIFVPDVGTTGSLWVSNGSAWVPASNPLTLAHKYSNASMDGSAGANTDVLLDSFTIPAYVLGPASGLRITAAFSFPGTGTGSKAPQVKAYFGVGTYASGFVSLLDSRGQFATQKSFLLNVTLQNQNSMAANQIRPNDYGIGTSGNAFGTANIDFSQNVTIGLGALNNSASTSSADQQVLNWFSVEMLS